MSTDESDVAQDAETARADAALEVLASWPAWWCRECHNRYGQPYRTCSCGGALTAVVVRILAARGVLDPAAEALAATAAELVERGRRQVREQFGHHTPVRAPDGGCRRCPLAVDDPIHMGEAGR